MMSPEKFEKILTKLPNKTKKIELNIVNELETKSKDLYQAVEKADNAWKDYQDYLSRADKPFTEMIESRNNLDTAMSFADGVAKRFLKAGEALGVDLKDNKVYLNIEDNLKTSRDVMNTIDSFKDPSDFQ